MCNFQSWFSQDMFGQSLQLMQSQISKYDWYKRSQLAPESHKKKGWWPYVTTCGFFLFGMAPYHLKQQKSFSLDFSSFLLFTRGTVNFPSRWSSYLSLALCLDHLVDHHLSSERRVQQCTTRGAAEMGNSKFQKYFSLITSPLTSQVFPPPFNCDNNHHPMSGILSKSNHLFWTPPQLSNLLKKMLNK